MLIEDVKWLKAVLITSHSGLFLFYLILFYLILFILLYKYIYRPFLFQKLPSITIIREPISRLISAFFYRGHSPNLDFFQVREEFKLIKDGLKPKVYINTYNY